MPSAYPKNLIQPVDDRQRTLTDKFIRPHLPDLMVELKVLRTAVDRAVGVESRRRSLRVSPHLERHAKLSSTQYCGDELSGIVEKRRRSFAPFLEEYPKGSCTGITHGVYEFLKTASDFFMQSPLTVLTNFREAGGAFRPIWGSIRNVYFQNALQVGSHYIDVANDTVDLTKPCIEEASLENSGFKNFETIGEYAHVRNVYMGDIHFLNRFTPALLPYRPLIFVNRNKRCVRIDPCDHLISRAIDLDAPSVFGSLGPPIIHDLKSPKVFDFLAAPFRSFAAHDHFLEFRQISTDEFTRSISSFIQTPRSERRIAHKTIDEKSRLINLLWSKAHMFDQIEPNLPT